MLDTQSVRLIGALKYDPGYLLLMDYLQAHLDNLTDELGTAGVAESLPLLHRWQAFRQILHTLKTAPASYAQNTEAENPDREDNPLGNDDWASSVK